ncbi:13627_t:CDS:1, partial [Entrophospora sp. SA101]
MTKNKNKKSVNLDDISIEDIANRLVQRLDRGHIFPPYYNDPEYFIPTVSGKKSFHKPKRPQNITELGVRGCNESLKFLQSGLHSLIE